MYHKSHGSHILTKKTTKRKRSLRQNRLIKKANLKQVKLMLPNL
jgi:large subunit ribosomal protein L35